MRGSGHAKCPCVGYADVRANKKFFVFPHIDG
jgi:hypothetical protein